jgi:hypothetical protein
MGTLLLPRRRRYHDRSRILEKGRPPIILLSLLIHLSPAPSAICVIDDVPSTCEGHMRVAFYESFTRCRPIVNEIHL